MREGERRAETGRGGEGEGEGEGAREGGGDIVLYGGMQRVFS